MAKATKQKNGKWRVQAYDYTDEQGKRHYRSFTGETKSHALFLASDFLNSKKKKTKHIGITVRDAVREYIDISEVLSPSTLLGYETILRTRFQPLMDMELDKLNQDIVQQAINDEYHQITYCGKPISAKTVCSSYGLISSAIKKYGLHYDVKLPKKKKVIKDFADPESIMMAIKDTDIELPCYLAMWLSLSISEIRGIDCSAIRNGVLHIEKVRIQMNGEDIVKDTGKVDTRIRNLQIPLYIMTLINNTDTYKNFLLTGENQPLIPMTQNQIYLRWKKICKTNDLGDMTFHNLRAVSASVMLMLNVPDKYAMERGGWKTTNVMKSVYQQTFPKERIEVDKKIDNYFENILNNIEGK